MPQRLPGMMRVLLLFAILGWLGWTVWRARRLLWPTPRNGVRRVEEASSLPQGALQAMADVPARIDGIDTQALWNLALARLEKYSGRLKWARLALDMEKIDPRGIAAVLLLFAVMGFLISNKPAGDRLAAAFSPWPTSLEGMALTAWVRPPDYTGLPPRQITLPIGGDTEIEVPARSRLILTATGDAPEFRLLGPSLDIRETSRNKLAEFNTELQRGHYFLRAGSLRPVSDFSVRIVKDGTPVIRFAAPLRVSLTQALDIKYEAEDDYGITALYLATVITKKAIAVPLPEPAPGQKISGKAFKDLTPSRYAGETVSLRLVALDAAGNYGVSAPVKMRLPERRFTHAVARQVIAARKQVWADPSRLEPPAARLDALSRNPQSFNDDLTIFSALRRSVWRLRSDQAWTEIDGITDFLWETALDLEAQKTGKDMADLRAKMDQLMAQMKLGGNNQKLMDQLMAEMAHYMASKAMAPDASGGMMDEAGQQMSAQVLEQLLEELQERMAAGDEAGARRVMEALQALMENARFGKGSGGRGPGGNNPMMQALGEAIARQQQLITQSRAAGASEGESGAPSDQLQGIARTQGTLADEMQKVRQAAGQSGSQSLDKAGRAMRQAEEALQKGDVPGAVRAQAEALQNLASARQQLAQQQGEGDGRGELPKGADPLGRYNGGANGPELPIPTASERQRLQQIRALLEERAADPARPAAERAYILRLLKRF